MRLLTPALAAALAALAAACSPPPPPPADASDASADEASPDGAPDAAPEASPDARDAAPDAALEAGADVLDAAPEAAPDATPDALEAGPADVIEAGPVGPDLSAIHTRAEFDAAYRTTCAATPGCVAREWAIAPGGSGSSCRYSTDGTLTYTVHVCAAGAAGICDDVTGTVRMFVGPPPTSLSAAPNAPFTADTVTGGYGPAYTAGGMSRRNFHVQFAATERAPGVAATGIPGVTVDPTRGDLWLLGCGAL